MAAPVLPPLLRDGERLTRDEFLQRWEAMPDLRWAELINGVVHMPSPVSFLHGDFQSRLILWMGPYLAATPGLAICGAGTWLMAPDSAPQPDVALLIKTERGGQSTKEGVYAAGAPELVVEISHSTYAKDSGVKRKLYERSGVQEYLIVRPRRQTIEWYRLVDGKYHEMPPGSDGIFRSEVFPGLWLDPEALWKFDLPALSAIVNKGVATEAHAAFADRLKA